MKQPHYSDDNLKITRADGAVYQFDSFTGRLRRTGLIDLTQARKHLDAKVKTAPLQADHKAEVLHAEFLRGTQLLGLPAYEKTPSWEVLDFPDPDGVA